MSLKTEVKSYWEDMGMKVSLLVVAALWTTALLVYDLIKGIGVANTPGRLLATGAVVWLGNTSRSPCSTG